MSRRLLFAAAVLALLWIAPLYFANNVKGSGYSLIGTNDFVEYWTAYQLFESDKNFYNPTLLQQEQLKLGRISAKPLMMWNPPWILPLMSAWLELPFLASAWSWLVFNAVLAVVIALLVWKTYSKSSPSVAVLAAALLFYPIFETIKLGQVSLIVTLGLVGWLWAVTRERYRAAGLFLVLISIKPHVPYLVLFAIGWWFIHNRPWRMFYSTLVAFGALLLLTWFGVPKSFSYWIASLGSSPVNAEAVRVVDWVVPTFVGVSRQLIEQTTGNFAVWPMVVIPAISVLFLGVLLISKRIETDWKKIVPPLICLSAMTSPFGWIFDQSLLVIPHVAILARAYDSNLENSRRWSVIFSLIASQLGVFYYSACCATFQHNFFWFSPLMLGLWLVCDYILRED